MSKEDADILFDKDCDKMANSTLMPLLHEYDLKLSQNQFDAIFAWMYNYGQNSFSKNDKEAYVTMRNFVRAGDYSVEETMRVFSNYMGKNALEGTKKRNKQLINMFLLGNYDSHH